MRSPTSAELSTHSAYRILDEAVRARVVDAIREALAGDVVLTVNTVLDLARRSS